MSKYHNRKIVVDGITFDSKKESDYYCQLKMLKMAGEVTDFSLQVPFELQPKYKYGNKTIRSIKYIADFKVKYKDGHEEIVDVKGVRTKEYLLKKKILLYQHQEIKFIEV